MPSFERRQAIALGAAWALYLAVALGSPLWPSLAKDVGPLFLPLLVLTGFAAPWWGGALVWAALVVLFAAMGTPVDVSLDLGFGVLGPAAAGFLFGLLFLGLGRALRFGYDHAVRTGRARAAAQEDAERAANLALVLRGAAHEVANPLSVLNIQVSNALADPALPRGSQARGALERIQGSVRRLDGTMHQLSDAALSMGGQLRLSPADVDLVPLLRDVAAGYADVLAEARLGFVQDLPERLPARCDPARIAQAVGNLLQNAARYTLPGGRVELRAERAGDEVAVAVRDTGVGMEADQVERLFQPLTRFRPDLSRGMGLGLWLVQATLRAHGGQAMAHSDGPGAGSTFTLRWPALVEAAAPASLAPAAPLPRAA